MSFKRLFAVSRTSAGSQSVYTVPTAKETVVSTIQIVNKETVPRTYIVRHLSGAEVGTEENNKVVPDNSVVPADGFVTISIGITMAVGDSIYITSGTSSTNMNFIGWGDERDI